MWDFLSAPESSPPCIDDDGHIIVKRFGRLVMIELGLDW
jgi:hypothetical protein